MFLRIANVYETFLQSLMLKAHYARTFIIFGNGDADGIVGQEILYQLGPLDKAEGSAIEVVLVAHVVHFLQLLDAVEVEVVNGKLPSLAAPILP